VLAVVAAVIVLTTRDNEPQYQGRSLSAWLQLTSLLSDESDSSGVRRAVLEIGTNAIPCLLKWIRAEPAPWQKMARSKLPGFVFQSSFGRSHLNWYEEAGMMRVRALHGFWALGTNAATAVPELKSILLDRAHLVDARASLVGLAFIGAPAFPTLAGAFSDTNYPYRRDILDTVGQISPRLVSPDMLQTFLRTALEDPDPKVRLVATHVIRDILPKLLTNAPAK
jgi:hypothetical protein